MRFGANTASSTEPDSEVEVSSGCVSQGLESYLLVPFYSLGAWAIDKSCPLVPALRHGDNLLPGVPHLLHFRLHVSPPGVSWQFSFPLPFADCMSDFELRFLSELESWLL